MRRLLLTTAALAAAVVFFLLAALPPAPLAVETAGVDADLARRTIAGAYHIHTTRSDGAGDKAAVASAAAGAGLAFAIITDHGDGTRPPDPPAYLNGVLCIDGVEISTNGGHYVALDMPAAPYPLGGDAAAVVEDVARLGGFGVVAHPDSPKADLAWTDWTAPFDAIEWLSADSEWRDETRTALARALAVYPFRPAPALASLLDRPETTIARWSRLLSERPVIALAALDAHGGMRRPIEGGMPGGFGPSYDASFRTLSNRVVLERPFSGDPAGDGRLLMSAIRKGRVYTVVDAIATPAFFDFSTSSPAWKVPAASRIDQIGADPRTARYEVHVAGAPGAPPVPWLLTNPVTFTAAGAHREPSVPGPGGVPVEGEWRVEKDAQSIATVAVPAAGFAVLEFRLAPGPRVSQFAALAIDPAARVPIQRIWFEAQAARPMRVSVQLRFAGTEERWVKSVYVDARRRALEVHVRQMTPAEGPSRPMPDPATARSLLFVVDLTNAAPGASGAFTLGNVRFHTGGPLDSRR